MNDYLLPFLSPSGATTAHLPVRYDAERDSPTLFETLSSVRPVVRDIAAVLRTVGLPLTPSSQVGTFGNFVRLPNHYRSVCFLVPGNNDGLGVDGVVAFKGTEPLLPDFPDYLDWMLRAPFRSTYLSLGLHFSLDMKLPPAAMWIEECLLEQQITSRIQSEYLVEHGQLARLPIPLFVFAFTEEQVDGYRRIVRARLSSGAFSRIEAKIAGGLGVEVYYYPSLPVRAADLFTKDVRKAFGGLLGAEALEAAFNDWIQLMAHLLALGYMPYAPWNHGMGAYVDPGNACIDGGFNDLLTIVPFDSIPNEHLFWRGLEQSIQMLASSVVTMCSAATDITPPSQPDPPAAAVAYVTARLREHIRSTERKKPSQSLDQRLVHFFEPPSVEDMLRHLRETQRDRSPAQFRPRESSAATQMDSATVIDSYSETPKVLGA